MATRTTNHGLYELVDNMPNWHHYFNCNVDILNEVALKIVGLSDVDFQALQNGSILKWDVASQKWKIVYSKEA